MYLWKYSAGTFGGFSRGIGLQPGSVSRQRQPPGRAELRTGVRRGQGSGYVEASPVSTSTPLALLQTTPRRPGPSQASAAPAYAPVSALTSRASDRGRNGVQDRDQRQRALQLFRSQ